MASVLPVLALILVGCSVSETYLTCYQCNPSPSGGPDPCKDPFTQAQNGSTCVGSTCVKSYADCGAVPTPQYCQGTTGNYVSRACLNATIRYDQCSTLRFTGGDVVYCLCNTDRCNDAQVMRPSNKMAAAVMAVMVSAMLV